MNMSVTFVTVDEESVIVKILRMSKVSMILHFFFFFIYVESFLLNPVVNQESRIEDFDPENIPKCR